MASDAHAEVSEGRPETERALRRESTLAGSATAGSSARIVNAFEGIRSDPSARQFAIGDILFAQFSCPQEEATVWTQTDYLMHLVSGTASFSCGTGAGTVGSGETVFLKKGVYFLPEHASQPVCVETYFIPDHFMREAIRQLADDLPPSAPEAVPAEMVIRVADDRSLLAFFQAMAVYFAAEAAPPESLLKLKLRELVTSLVLSPSNPVLSAYLRAVAAADSPALPAVMEANYHHNLPLATFARLCHRSLSAFKRDFRKHYGTSPGRWLLEQRLERAFSLLKTTHASITEIMLDCGFEDPSHFSKAFKERFGRPPSAHRRGTIVV